MEKTVLVSRSFENGTVKDDLGKTLSDLRNKGFSIFGINEHQKLPKSNGTRWVTIFYDCQET